MRINYPPFVDRMIKRYEGGYCWDKADPGGPTNFGITCYDYAEFLGEKMTSMAAWAPRVKAMKLSEAEEIYRRKYATKCKFDDLNSGKDCVLFDYGVNSGVARPPRVAGALLKINATTMTPELVKAINAADPIWFVDAVCQERLAFMKRIRGGSAYKTFGKGWKARVDDLDKYCDALAERAKSGKAVAVPPPDLSKVPTPKAVHPEPSGKTNTGGTVATGGAAGTAAASAGFPVWLVVLLVVAVVAGGVALFIWNKRRAKKANELVIIPATVGEQPK